MKECWYVLKEISCDEFIENGKVRPPLVFHKGLNVVLGRDLGTNSIGKSTFLMILDFVFGGSDYAKKDTDVQSEVGEHTIKFQFEFNGKNFYFTRSTGDFNTVIRCNSKYLPLSKDAELTIDKYCEFLADKYGIRETSFRNTVSSFIRVAGRDTNDQTHPLQANSKEKMEQQISKLLKIFNKYGPIEERSKCAKEAEKKYKAFKTSGKYKFMPITKNKSEYDSKQREIDQLHTEIESLKERTQQDLPTLDEVQAAELKRFYSELKVLVNQRNHNQKRLELVQENRNIGPVRFQRDYQELKEFFPEVDLKKVQMVEAFHRQLYKNLKVEFDNTERQLQDRIFDLQSQIKVLKEKINDAKGGQITSITDEIFKQYSELRQQIDVLKKSNENYLEEIQLKEDKKDQGDALERITKEQSIQVQNLLNGKMAELNEVICGSSRYIAPRIEIESSKKYVFETPNDHGTGTSYKGLILFDEACLKLTELPIIVHDTIIFSDIEIPRVEKIIEMYLEENDKQIFIALDKLEQYSDSIQEKVNENTILRLERGGKELFGRSWNEKD